MRLKSELWVQGYLQKMSASMIPAFVIRRGHESAGAIFIKVNRLDGTCNIFSPAPAPLNTGNQPGHDDRCWTDYWASDSQKPESTMTEKAADSYLAEQASYDGDIWVIEIEDRSGTPYLEKHNLTQ